MPADRSERARLVAVVLGSGRCLHGAVFDHVAHPVQGSGARLVVDGQLRLFRIHQLSAGLTDEAAEEPLVDRHFKAPALARDGELLRGLMQLIPSGRRGQTHLVEEGLVVVEHRRGTVERQRVEALAPVAVNHEAVVEVFLRVKAHIASMSLSSAKAP